MSLKLVLYGVLYNTSYVMQHCVYNSSYVI